MLGHVSPPTMKTSHGRSRSLLRLVRSHTASWFSC